MRQVGPRFFAAGEFVKRVVEGAFGSVVGRHVPGAYALQALSAPVAFALQDQHVQPFLEQGDERQERVAAWFAAEEVVGERVGGGDDDHAAFEQGGEQAAEDHGVHDVVHLELVEAQQGGFGGDGVGERRDGVVAGGVRLLPFMHASVGFLHKAVEVDASFAGDLGLGEEQVHQHGFAAPDVADEVEAAWPVGRGAFPWAPAQEAAQQAFGRRGLRIVAAQLDPHVLQALGGQVLGVVCDQAAFFDQAAIRSERALAGGQVCGRIRVHDQAGT